MRPGPATSTPRCCPSSSGSSAPSTRTPWPFAATSPPGPGEAGDAAGARDEYAALLPIRERVSGPEHPDTLAARQQLASWTGEAGDAAAGPRRVRRAAAHHQAGIRPGAPGHPDRPRQPRLLDRAGGGRGPRPRRVRRAAAHHQAGPRPEAPEYPDHPARARRLDLEDSQEAAREVASRCLWRFDGY